MEKKRIDLLLVEQGFFDSREKAKREKSEAAEKIEKAAKEKKAGAPKAKKGNIFKRIGKWFSSIMFLTLITFSP